MKIIFHFGAHKTASSHLQHNLAINRELLEKHGIIYFKFHEIPELRREAIKLRRNFKLPSFDSNKSAQKIRTLIEAKIEGYETALISYEGVLGDLNHSNYETIYEDAEELISIYQHILKDYYVIPVFTIRNYDGFLRSTYKYMLKTTKHFTFTLNDYLSKIKVIPNRWTQICDALNKSFDGPLTVFTQEDYRTDWQEIIQEIINLTGKSIDSLRFDSEDKNVSKKKDLLDLYFTANQFYQRTPKFILKDRLYYSSRYRLSKLIKNKLFLSLLLKHQEEKIPPVNELDVYKREVELLKRDYGIL